MCDLMCDMMCDMMCDLMCHLTYYLLHEASLVEAMPLSSAYQAGPTNTMNYKDIS